MRGRLYCRRDLDRLSGSLCYPRKNRNENKIDGPVAHMMALARWMTAEVEGPSVYETRGILEIEV